MKKKTFFIFMKLPTATISAFACTRARASERASWNNAARKVINNSYHNTATATATAAAAPTVTQDCLVAAGRELSSKVESSSFVLLPRQAWLLCNRLQLCCCPEQLINGLPWRGSAYLEASLAFSWDSRMRLFMSPTCQLSHLDRPPPLPAHLQWARRAE